MGTYSVNGQRRTSEAILVMELSHKSQMHRLGQAMSVLQQECFAAGWTDATSQIETACCQALKAQSRQKLGIGEMCLARANYLSWMACEIGSWPGPNFDDEFVEEYPVSAELRSLQPTIAGDVLSGNPATPDLDRRDFRFQYIGAALRDLQFECTGDDLLKTTPEIVRLCQRAVSRRERQMWSQGEVALPRARWLLEAASEFGELPTHYDVATQRFVGMFDLKDA